MAEYCRLSLALLAQLFATFLKLAHPFDVAFVGADTRGRDSCALAERVDRNPAVEWRDVVELVIEKFPQDVARVFDVF
jgi:hypothetical protein